MYNQKPLLGGLINWAHPLSKGLVGAWLFNENSGNNIFDLSGNGNHGTFGAGAATPSWIPEGLNFDGGDHIDCGADKTLKTTSLITISSWINLNTLNAYNGIYSDSYDSGNWGYILRVRDDNYPYFEAVQASPLQAKAAKGSYTLSTGIWYYLVGVREANNIYLYVNGVKEGTDTISGASRSSVGYPTRIGGYFSNNFNGIIKDVNVYNKGLTPSGIRQLYVDPYCWLAQPFSAELMYAAPPVGVMSPYYYESLMAGAVI